MSKKQIKCIVCGERVLKKDALTCSICGGSLCPSHAYFYVDGNNIAITKSAKAQCLWCSGVGVIDSEEKNESALRVMYLLMDLKPEKGSRTYWIIDNLVAKIEAFEEVQYPISVAK